MTAYTTNLLIDKYLLQIEKIYIRVGSLAPKIGILYLNYLIKEELVLFYVKGIKSA